MNKILKKKVLRRLAVLMAVSMAASPLAAQSLDDPSKVLPPVKGQASHVKYHALPATGKDSDGYPPLVLGPGDLISVSIYGDSEVPAEYQLDMKGAIVFPYVGRVELAGLTPTQAAEHIASLARKPHNVSVILEESNDFYVSVLGVVAHPGNYQIRSKPTPLFLLAEAGGDLPGADLGNSYILRGSDRFRIDLNRYARGAADPSLQPLLYPGDTLMVPRQGFPSSAGDFAVLTGIIASLAVALYYLHQNNIIRF